MSQINEILNNDCLSNAQTIFTISDCSEQAYGCFLEGKSSATWFSSNHEEDELLSNPKELKSFDENIVDIIIYIYEKTSMDCIAEFAYHNGLTLKEIKERLYGFYKYLLDK